MGDNGSRDSEFRRKTINENRLQKGDLEMKRRNRRSASEVKDVQQRFLEAVKKEGEITLTDLIAKYGEAVNVKNTASDKNLVKRQLSQASKQGVIEFRREGRDLVARVPGRAAAAAAPPRKAAARRPRGRRAAVRKAAAAPAPRPTPAPPAPPPPVPADLAAIRAYAAQLEEFSKTLQHQIATLVRMVEKAS